MSQWCNALKKVGALAVFIVIVSLIELVIFKDGESVGIGISTGVISGLFVLIFQKGILEDQTEVPPAMTEPAIEIDESTRVRGIQRIELELKIDSLYLTAIGLAFTVESVFISFYSKALLSGVIDMQFVQISGISVGFIIFMIYAWCDYKNKMNEVARLFS